MHTQPYKTQPRSISFVLFTPPGHGTTKITEIGQIVLRTLGSDGCLPVFSLKLAHYLGTCAKYHAHKGNTNANAQCIIVVVING